ncbi:Prolyl oligopeptidase [Psidium guajava]|nr:Prolyl oligopeptidase [Psidium guajava]
MRATSWPPHKGSNVCPQLHVNNRTVTRRCDSSCKSTIFLFHIPSLLPFTKSVDDRHDASAMHQQQTLPATSLLALDKTNPI